MSKNKIKILDCTLRDGGCINDFNFGESDMQNIKNSIENSNIEVIEVGYINDTKGSSIDRSQFDSILSANRFLLPKKSNIEYVAMIDYGTFDFDNLPFKDQDSLDGIRLAFHKKDRFEALKIGMQIINQGYKAFIQPMLITSYSELEIIEFIELINTRLPQIEALYIVDSFGQMYPEDVTKFLSLFDKLLIPNINLGFHGHNNLQFANGNSLQILKSEIERTLYLDVSLMGMGKGAGNATTEIITSYFNSHIENRYELKSISDCIFNIIAKYQQQFFWGYSLQNYLCSTVGCTPSYASYFLKTKKVDLHNLKILLESLDDSQKAAFNPSHADNLYLKFTSEK